jgi:hypothetical protein
VSVEIIFVVSIESLLVALVEKLSVFAADEYKPIFAAPTAKTGKAAVPEFPMMAPEPVSVLIPEIFCAVVRSTYVELVGIWLTSANVPVDVGNVSVPVLVMVLITGAAVNVLTAEIVWIVLVVTKLVTLGI